MKTSKLFLTSLLAAAATMSVPVYAGFVWNGGENIDQGLWQTKDSWTLTDGTTWSEVGTGPMTTDSNMWAPTTVADASGTISGLEGWNLRLTLTNASLEIGTLEKFQGGLCAINLDAGSVLTVNNFSGGNDGDSTTLNIEGVFNLTYNKDQGGAGFVANLGNGGVLNFSAYDATRRTAKVSHLNATLNITDFDSYTIDANGNTVYTRNLITLSGNVAFDATNTTETMTAGAGVGTLIRVEEGDISGAAAGSYKVTKGDSGYSVSYVVAGTTYAWNATAADSVWDTSATNWTTDGGSTNVAFTSGNVFFGSGEALSKTVAINSAVTAGTISVADDYTFNVGTDGSLAGTFFVSSGKTATLNLTAASSISAGVASGVVKKTGSSALTYSGTISSGAMLEIAEGGTTDRPNVFSGTLSQGATLNISGGVTKIPGGNGQANGPIQGDLTIGVGAVAIGTGTDAIPWGADLAHTQIIRVLGTLQLDARWSMNSGKKIVLSGGRITGAGGSNNNQTVSLDYFGSGTIATEVGAARSQISANIRIKDTLTFDAAADLAVSGDIVKTDDTNPAKIVKQGTGTLTLSGTNTYRSLEISAGKLVAASEGALGSGAVTVNGTGSILDVNLSETETLTQGANQALTTTDGGKITVSAGTLALMGAVNLSNAIEVANGARVTTSGEVSFALAGLTGTSNEDGSTTFTLFTLESGASLAWNSLTADRINLAGTSITGRGATATFDNAAGTVTVVSGTAGDLVWNGASGSSTWNYSAANTNWKIGDVVNSFQNRDNVTFGADAAAKTVTLENGANLKVGTMTVEGGDYILNAGAGNSATISGATLTVASGASLQLSSDLGAGASALRLGFDNISVAGTLKVYTNSTDTWSKLTFAGAGSRNLYLHDIGGDANTTGLTISTMQMDAAGLLTAYWGGRVAISALTGSGDLTIKKPAQSSTTYAIGSLANYTGTLSMEGSGQELTVLLTENNTGFTGNVKVSTGILGVNNSNALGSGTLTLNGGTLRADANNLSFANAVNVTAASIINTKGNTLTLTSVTIADEKALQVLNSAAPSGATTIDSLTVSGASATVRIGTAANDGGGSHHGRILIKDIAAGTGTLNLELKANTTVRSIFELGASDVDSTGAFTGTIAFSGSNSGTNRSGSLVISNGAVASNAEIRLASTKSAGAILSLGVNASSVTIGGLSSSLGTTKAKVYSGAIELGSAYDAAYGNSATSTGTKRTLVINTAEGKNCSFNGEILANLNLEKTGVGAQTLAGASAAFNGSVTISQGVLALADAAAIGTGNTVRIAGGQLKVGNGTTAVSLNAAAYTIVLSDAYSETSGTGVAAIVGTDTTSKSSVALKTDTKITIELADSVAVSLAAEAAQYQYKIFDVATIAADSFSVDNFVLAEALQGTWQISDYTNGVLTLTIPEPSVFGLLAGLGALALAGTRRRRRKA